MYQHTLGRNPFIAKSAELHFLIIHFLKDTCPLTLGRNLFLVKSVELNSLNIQITKHICQHTREINLFTKICDLKSRVSLSSYLKTHMSTHSKEKHVHCDISGAAFSENSNLKRHVLAHSWEKRLWKLLSYVFIEFFSKKTNVNTHQRETISLSNLLVTFLINITFYTVLWKVFHV